MGNIYVNDGTLVNYFAIYEQCYIWAQNQTTVTLVKSINNLNESDCRMSSFTFEIGNNTNCNEIPSSHMTMWILNAPFLPPSPQNQDNPREDKRILVVVAVLACMTVFGLIFFGCWQKNKQRRTQQMEVETSAYLDDYKRLDE